MSVLQRLTVTKMGFGGRTMRFHPSHDMGSLYCWQCGAWGWDDTSRFRLCRKPRQTGIGL